MYLSFHCAILVQLLVFSFSREYQSNLAYKQHHVESQLIPNASVRVQKFHLTTWPTNSIIVSTIIYITCISMHTEISQVYPGSTCTEYYCFIYQMYL